MFCLIQFLPNSRLQSILVEEMQVLREKRGGRTSQETFPTGGGRRIFQTEGSAQAEAWRVRGVPGRGASVQAGLRGTGQLGHVLWAPDLGRLRVTVRPPSPSGQSVRFCFRKAGLGLPLLSCSLGTRLRTQHRRWVNWELRDGCSLRLAERTTYTVGYRWGNSSG